MNRTTTFYDYKINVFVSEHLYILPLCLIVMTILMIVGLALCSYVYREFKEKQRGCEKERDKENKQEIEMIEMVEITSDIYVQL